MGLFTRDWGQPGLSPLQIPITQLAQSPCRLADTWFWGHPGWVKAVIWYTCWPLATRVHAFPVCITAGVLQHLIYFKITSSFRLFKSKGNYPSAHGNLTHFFFHNIIKSISVSVITPVVCCRKSTPNILIEMVICTPSAIRLRKSLNFIFSTFPGSSFYSASSNFISQSPQITFTSFVALIMHQHPGQTYFRIDCLVLDAPGSFSSGFLKSWNFSSCKLWTKAFASWFSFVLVQVML